MAVSSYIPQTLAEMKKVNQVTAERWIKDNASWVAAMVAKHDSWIKDNAVDLYQAAYDGELDEIEQRDKARDGGTENKLVSNYVQIIIDDTLVRRVFYCRNIARASNTGRGTRQRGTLDIADGLNTERSF